MAMMTDMIVGRKKQILVQSGTKIANSKSMSSLSKYLIDTFRSC
jgi:hypothetical protein